MAQDVANSINYATNGSYAPSGQRTYVSLAHFWGSNPKYIGVIQSFSNRLQPVAMSATAFDVMQPSNNVTFLNLSYDFQAGVSNNGNVMGITNNLDSGRSQTFTYDELNRIKTAQTQAISGSFCWGLTFGYDVWANLKTTTPNIPGCPTESLNLTINTLNRIADTGYTYDPAGNLTANPATSATYQYDAESRMSSAATTLGNATYIYDGDGRRVMKGTNELYWHGMGADPLLESDAAGNITDEFIFFGGSRIARRASTGTVYYYVGDHLGSSRVIAFTYTNKFGISGHTKCYEADYLPFGQERVITDTCPQPYKFTGKERDSESGLDFFGARYYSSQQGRFLSPDEFTGGPVDAFSSNDPLPPGPLPYADITDPQSLNKYTYAWNNPLHYVDPDGHQNGTTTAPVKVDVKTTVRAVMLSEGEAAPAAAASTANTVSLGTRILQAGSTVLAAVGVVLGAYDVITILSDNYVEANLRQQEQDAMLSQMASEQNKKKEGSSGGETEGRPFTKKQRQADAGKKCDYCGKRTTEKSGKPSSRETDHIMPRSRGGNATDKNKATACRTCNRKKGAKTPSEWEASKKKEKKKN